MKKVFVLETVEEEAVYVIEVEDTAPKETTYTLRHTTSEIWSSSSKGTKQLVVIDDGNDITIKPIEKKGLSVIGNPSDVTIRGHYSFLTELYILLGYVHRNQSSYKTKYIYVEGEPLDSTIEETKTTSKQLPIPYDNKEIEYPCVMEVSIRSDFDTNQPKKRVVFMEKNGQYLAWKGATCFAEAEDETEVVAWEYARMPLSEGESKNKKQIELTFEDIAEKFGVDPKSIKIVKE